MMKHVSFSHEMLTDFERIGDHAWNVAKQMAKIIERG